ncbi:hypothetical protein ZWY2020_017418 [Hordeum vulgare]|nr:hypothetical protein ZWY2020_017418 [Hordeum vulgare]
MVAGGGETGNAPGVARVLRAALAPRLTCPLCKGYFRDANAFKQCGHTFCLECIMKKIDEEEIETCPVCDDALGIAPEEKLRADESIQAIRDSVFPHETEVDASEPPTITLPATIEERSISNFVETPKMAPKSTKMTISANKNKVSSILKLLIKKLELASDAKVEILCHDKSVCPSTTLQGLLKRWLSCKPKDKVQRPVGAPADEFVMELHYRQCLGSKYLCSGKKITSLICHCST